ncbi:MAG: hypothetical protein WC406_02945 [Methanoregula sp.]|jgi:hypothetical protein
MHGQTSYKRIPISPATWERLSLLKKPGETFDQLISDLVEERHADEIVCHVRKVSETGEFIPLDTAAEMWELK